MRVVAVVVTFNRLPLLRRLVARLREVPEVDEVLVVDNASSDGTGEWLAATGVVHRTLPENRGGAGGFHDGLGWAMERGADLAWLMDDDGIPDLDSLAILLERENLDFWGPAVLAEQDPGRLCFPIRLPGGTRVVHRMAEVEAAAVDGLIAGVVIPFNGVLVTRDLVDRIGLPREEFFIWGDDVEYLWRAERAGARVATVVGAHFRHPATDDLGTPMMFGRTTYNHSASDLKHYCMARNNLLNLRDYRGWPHALAFVVKTVWFYLFTKPQPGRVVLSARAMYAGLRGDFTGHRAFLGGGGGGGGFVARRLRSSHLNHRGHAWLRWRAERATGPETVAIAVVTYNRADLLAGMLAGLAALDRPADAVIVVDNASTDHTAEVLAASTLPGPAGAPRRGEPRRRGRLPPRGAHGVHAGLRPDLADGRRRRPGARSA